MKVKVGGGYEWTRVLTGSCGKTKSAFVQIVNNT